MIEKLSVFIIIPLNVPAFAVNFLCKVELNNFQNMTRGHRELLEIKSLFKIRNTSVNSVVLFKCIFWVTLFYHDFQKRLLGMETVFSLVKDSAVRTVHDLICDLLAAMGRKAVQHSDILF